MVYERKLSRSLAQLRTTHRKRPHRICVSLLFCVDLIAGLQKLSTEQIGHGELFCVYRSSAISRDEEERLKIGSFVSARSFFSTSRSIDVAQVFDGVDRAVLSLHTRNQYDDSQRVLFKIVVHSDDSSNTLVADVSSKSAFPGKKRGYIRSRDYFHY